MKKIDLLVVEDISQHNNNLIFVSEINRLKQHIADLQVAIKEMGKNIK